MRNEQSTEPFTIAFMPGVTVTRWTRAWAERRPDVPLELVRTSETDQGAVLHDGTADVSFVRLPIEQDGLNVVPLYREIAVVVASKDHAIAAVDSVTLADLEGEPIQPDPEAFDLVAAGVGILVLPHSVARLQSRKDLVSRPVTDAEETQIALAWRVNPEPALAERIEQFVGIVRGRTARSSRAPGAEDAAAEVTALTKSAEKAAAKRANAAKAAAKSGAKSAGTSAGSTAGPSARKPGASARGGSYSQQRKAAAARKKHRGR